VHLLFAFVELVGGAPLILDATDAATNPLCQETQQNCHSNERPGRRLLISGSYSGTDKGRAT
jgi:hypothetical protein